MDDNKIIELFFARNENAIRETDGKYSKYLLFISMNILNNMDDSYECVNDTYFKAWNTIPPSNPSSLKFFLGKIARHLSIDRLRRRFAGKRACSEYEISLDELAECVPDIGAIASKKNTLGDPEGEYDKVELSLFIDNYLSEQKHDVRDMFVMRYYFCDSIKQIAANLGVSEGKVKSCLFRAREGLRKRLEKEGFSI